MVYEIMIKFVTRTETAIEIISLLLLSSYIFRVTKNEITGRQTISAEYLNNFDNVSAFPGTSRLSVVCVREFMFEVDIMCVCVCLVKYSIFMFSFELRTAFSFDVMLENSK